MTMNFRLANFCSFFVFGWKMFGSFQAVRIFLLAANIYNSSTLALTAYSANIPISKTTLPF